MNNWDVRTLLAAGGVWAGQLWSWTGHWSGASALLGVGSLVVLVFPQLRRLAWAFVALWLAVSAIAGWTGAEMTRAALLTAPDGSVQVVGKVISPSKSGNQDGMFVTHLALTQIDQRGGVGAATILSDQQSAQRYGEVLVWEVETIDRYTAVSEPTDSGSPDILARAREPPTVLSAGSPVDRWVQYMRDSFANSLSCEDDPCSLLTGLTTGDETGQSAAFGQAMLESGLSHLTAVSGGNIATLGVLVLGICRVARCNRRWQLAALVVSIVSYALVVGPQPSVTRAATMGLIATLALVWGGAFANISTLGTSVLLLLLFDPTLAKSLGFQLSVVATSGIVLLGPTLVRRLRAVLPVTLASVLAISLVAAIVTAPVLWSQGLSVPLASVLANVLVSPLIPLLTGIGLLSLPLSVFFAGVAQVLLAGGVWGAQWVVAVAYAGAEAGASWLIWPAALVPGVWFSYRVRHRIRDRVRWPVLGLAASLVIIVLFAEVAVAPGNRTPWRLAMCDVGQGSATVVRSTEFVALIDTGLDNGRSRRCLRDLGVDALDYLFISHLDQDHVGALGPLLNQTVPQTIYWTSIGQDQADQHHLRELAGQHNVQLTELSAGQHLRLGTVTVAVLWPEVGVNAGQSNNDGSLVLHVSWADGPTALITGDIGAQEQAVLMRAQPVATDVVTVPHHGSADLDPGFADWVGAKAAVVSAGRENRYGHPTQRAMREFAEFGRLLRTDEDGTVAFAWDGDRLEVVGV